MNERSEEELFEQAVATTISTLKSSRAFLKREFEQYPEFGTGPEEIAYTHQLIEHFDAILKYYNHGVKL